MRTKTTALAGALVLGAAGCAPAGLPAGATDQATLMHIDWVVFFWAGIGVAVLVWSLILIPTLLWRRKGDDYPAQVKQNTRLELTYTVIPVLVVAALFWLTLRVEGAVERLIPHPASTVDVTAFRWSWRFDYPGTAISIVGTPQQPPELVLPADQTTQINLRSIDVDHAFWIPAFLFKRDAIPGVVNRFDLRPHTLGVFRGECGEFCGLYHGLMTFRVRVVPRAEYDNWLHAGGVLPS